MDRNDIEKAKALLISSNYTCVICKGIDVYTSTLRGVKPLMQWLDSEMSFKDYAAADKVIGKATAFLYVLLGVRSVYAKAISKPALEVLKKHEILTEYETLVDNIINRQGDGICPFETEVLEITDVQSAYEAILRKFLSYSV